MNIVSIATKQLDTPKSLIRGIVTSTCERIKMFSQDSHSKAAHLYSNNAGDTIHIVQPANKLADDRVQPGAEASAGDNGRVHLIGLEIHPLPRPGTPEVSSPRTGLMNNNLQSVMHKISSKKSHSEVFNSLFAKKKTHLLRDCVVWVDEILPERTRGRKKGQLWNIRVWMDKNQIRMETVEWKHEMRRILT